MTQSLAAAVLLLGHALSQNAPAASSQSAKPASTQSTAPSGQAGAAKKPATATKTATPYTLKTQKEKESYALGMNIGSSLQKQGVGSAVDSAVVARGVRDALAGNKTLLTDQQMSDALKQLREDVHKAQDAKAHLEGAASRKAGEAFLAANKSKDGVKVLADGLQYKILTEGTGPKPSATDTVMVNYRGTLIDGKEFDASEKHGGAQPLQVNHVIPGWTEALQMMSVGSKWQLYIPADLAYGDASPPGSGIPAGSTLVFDVELLSIGEPKK